MYEFIFEENVVEEPEAVEDKAYAIVSPDVPVLVLRTNLSTRIRHKSSLVPTPPAGMTPALWKCILHGSDAGLVCSSRARSLAQQCAAPTGQLLVCVFLASSRSYRVLGHAVCLVIDSDEIVQRRYYQVSCLFCRKLVGVQLAVDNKLPV